MKELARLLIPIGDEIHLVLVRKLGDGSIYYLVPNGARDYILWMEDLEDLPEICGLGEVKEDEEGEGK